MNSECQSILVTGVTSYYVIDQSMISICYMKNIFGDEAKHI